MHVVIVDGDVSYPATSGKRLRTLNLMLQVAKRHRITYVGRCAADTEEARTAPTFLRAHNIEPILVHHPVPTKAGPAFFFRMFANLFSSQPYSVASHHSEPMGQTISELARREPVDIWQFEWSPYLSVVDSSLPGPRVVMAHNVDTLIWQRYYENETSLLKRAYLRMQWQRFRRFEERAFAQATRVVAVSEPDAMLIREQFGQPNVDVVENGIDRAYFENVTGQRDPLSILFLGALDWRPNLDAIALMLDKTFPAVRSQQPNARLVIVGRHPSAHLRQRTSAMPGVELHADVADVRPYLASAGVLAVPLRIGGGSRLKILEALACGLPVVSTAVGAEGLSLQPNENYTQAEIDQMADALIQSIRNPSIMQAMAAHGRRRVLDIYDWSVLAGKLESAWERSLQNQTKTPGIAHPGLTANIR